MSQEAEHKANIVRWVDRLAIPMLLGGVLVVCAARARSFETYRKNEKQVNALNLKSLAIIDETRRALKTDDDIICAFVMIQKSTGLGDWDHIVGRVPSGRGRTVLAYVHSKKKNFDAASSEIGEELARYLGRGTAPDYKKFHGSAFYVSPHPGAAPQFLSAPAFQKEAAHQIVIKRMSADPIKFSDILNRTIKVNMPGGKSSKTVLVPGG